MTTSATGTGIAAVTVSGESFSAEIAYEGATLLSWRPRLADGCEGENLVDGYLTPAELHSQNGVRNGILAPFANRIPNGQYDFGGKMHHIKPVLAHEALVFHGFARALPFALEQSFEKNGAHVLIFRSEISPSDFRGYPYRLIIEVEYRFDGQAVSIDIRGVNHGDQPLPFAAGWHPYFRLPGPSSIDDLHLTLPSRTAIVTDDHLIPLHDGQAEIIKRDDSRFLVATPIADHVLDLCFTDLIASENGLFETRLENRHDGSSLTVWQERGHMHVFTGDTLARDRRKSIALEPVEMPTNAFNHPELTAAVTLQPGETRSFRFGVHFEAAR
ncbi:MULTISPECIES: aldose 1-epimerase [unclassified Agrobacterium]|uniref:aldose 1-epimerase n=1 Tax=unclassified Agrobacterium TaxID=2632611 RepID=UPI00069C2ADB|nr:MULTISPECIES: aldose 1-epimerase [unclassified Agrobacterium]KNY32623.1 aldose epimerase [Agrobacterium sp. SUL3]MCD4662588.1 aldose 1-epimerase [Agrobacterium sp.]